MKKRNKIAAALFSILCSAFLLGGCTDAQGPVQTSDFSPEDIKSIEADYDGESITIKESTSNQITIVEYMNKTKKSYFAKVDLQNGILTITEGARPIGNGVHSSLEIYLPESYQRSLSLHTTDGSISSALTLPLSSLCADTTNGAVELANLSPEQIRVTSASGEITLKNLVTESCTIDTTNANTYLDGIGGTISYESKGGNLTVTNASGSGHFQATGDGDLNIAFKTVSGDLSAYAKNGKLALTLPSDLDFIFSATTKDGSIQTTFPDSLSSAGDTVGGTIGDHAEIKIGLETKNGDIAVTVP